MKRKIIMLVSLLMLFGTISSQVAINTNSLIGILHIDAKNDLDETNNVVVNTDGNVSIGFTGNWTKLAVNGDVALGENVPGEMGYGSKIYFEGAKHVNDLWMSKYNVAPDITELRVNIGIENGGPNRFEVGRWAYETGTYLTSWYVSTDGVSRIGNIETVPSFTSDSLFSERLLVSGSVWASDGIIVESNNLKSKVQQQTYDLNDFCRMVKDDNLQNRMEATSTEIEIGTSVTNLVQDINALTRYTAETYDLLQEKLRDYIIDIVNYAK